MSKNTPSSPIRRKAMPANVTLSPDDERAVIAVINTADVDFEGEVVVPQGMNAKQFNENPVVFFAHSYGDWMKDDIEGWDPRIPVGKVTALKKGDDIEAKVWFVDRPPEHPEGQAWLPDKLFWLYQKGVINGFSIGFRRLEGRPASDRDVQKYGEGCRFVTSKWQLLELSVAPLPCNGAALADAVSKGIVSQGSAAKFVTKDTKTAETKPEMGTCGKCMKEFPLDDMTMTDGDGDDACYTCAECMNAAPEQKTAPVEPAPEPRRVVAEVECIATPSAPTVKRIHMAVDAPAPAPRRKNVEIVIAEVLQRQIGKARGRIYAE